MEKISHSKAALDVAKKEVLLVDIYIIFRYDGCIQMGVVVFVRVLLKSNCLGIEAKTQLFACL